MMNREQALQWLVDNVKAWPWSKQVMPFIENPEGWEWSATSGKWKQLVCCNGLITHDDWIHAKQPAPLTRDEALAWLVESVKAWPDESSDFMHRPDGWKWNQHSSGVYRLLKNDLVACILETDWQAAQPAPSSNKPSWDDAPEGAKILAQDEDGTWGFCSHNNVKASGGQGKWMVPWNEYKNDMWLFSITDTPNPNWRDTLEYRPTKEEPTMATESHTSLPTGSEWASMNFSKKEDDVLQYVPTNLARIKQLNDEIELAKLSIESMKIELAERTKEVKDVLNYCKFNT